MKAGCSKNKRLTAMKAVLKAMVDSNEGCRLGFWFAKSEAAPRI